MLTTVKYMFVSIQMRFKNTFVINRLRYLVEYTNIYCYTVLQVKQISFNKLGFAKSLCSQDKVRTLSV